MSSTPSLDPSAMLASQSAELLPDSEADPPSANPLPEHAAELWLYRSRTTALLRRYLRFSIEVGRLPSILGRELFRSKVTSYRMASFEDAVIFVYDVERALAQLNAFAQLLIATIIFQEYSQDEAAERLRCARRTICREFPEALDRMSEICLEGGLLNRLPCAAVENSCQGGPKGDFGLSDCKQGEYICAKYGTISFSECYSENREQEKRARPWRRAFLFAHPWPPCRKSSRPPHRPSCAECGGDGAASHRRGK